MNHNKNACLAAFAAAACLLSACNDQNSPLARPILTQPTLPPGSPSPAPAPAPAPTPAPAPAPAPAPVPIASFSLGSTGSAGKGIIIGAAVDALEVTSTGLISRGTGVTGEDGSFSVSLSSYTGQPILFRLKGGGSAMMKCDVRAGCRDGSNAAVAFGARFGLASSFVMEGISAGIAQADAAGGLTACVSPFTHLAASRAKELAGGMAEKITAGQANRAITEIRLLTGGVDVSNLCVVDLTDPAKVDAATPEQRAHALFSAAALALTPGLDPSTSLDALTLAFKGGTIAATDSDTSKLALADLSSAAQDEAMAGGIPVPANVQLVQMTAQQAASNGNSVQPCSTDPCGGTSEQATASEKARQVFGELRSLYRNTEEEITNPAKAFADQLEAAELAARPSLRQINDALSFGLGRAAKFYTGNNMSAGSSTLNTTNAAGSSQSATITVKNNADNVDEISLKGNVRDAVVDVTLTLPHSIEGAGTLRATLLGSAQNTGPSGSKLTIPEASVTLVGALNSEGDSVPDQLTVSGQAVLAEFGIADPVSVEGRLELDGLRCTGCGGNNLDLVYNPRLAAIGGKVSNSGNATSLSVRFDVEAASARSYNSRLPYSASNFVKGSLSASTALSLSGSAPYSVVVALNSTGFDAAKNQALGNLNVKLARGDKFYDIVAPVALTNREGDEDGFAAPQTVSLTISTANNVLIAVNDIPTDDQKPISGSILVGGVEAASISETDSGLVLIRYKDGVIESLY